MAISKKYNIEIKYSNERLQRDLLFKNNFPQFKDTLKENLEVDSAYIVVSGIYGSKNSLNCAVEVYKDSSKTCLIESKHYVFAPDVSDENTPNFYTQAYNYLKTLDEYKNAIDC